MTTTKDYPEELLREDEAARRLNVSVKTMRRWRLLRLPPAWVKLAGAVRYRPETIQRLIESREQTVDSR